MRSRVHHTTWKRRLLNRNVCMEVQIMSKLAHHLALPFRFADGFLGSTAVSTCFLIPDIAPRAALAIVRMDFRLTETSSVKAR